MVKLQNGDIILFGDIYTIELDIPRHTIFINFEAEEYKQIWYGDLPDADKIIKTDFEILLKNIRSYKIDSDIYINLNFILMMRLYKYGSQLVIEYQFPKGKIELYSTKIEFNKILKLLERKEKLKKI